MKKRLIISLLLISHWGFGQLKYRHILDSLNCCFEQLDFTIDYNHQKNGLKLISKYHPAYIQTYVGDGTEIVTNKMIKKNHVYKTVSDNKKSVILLTTTKPYGGWVVVIDFKKLDTSNIRIINDTICIIDTVKGFKCNMAHRLWKGFIETKTVKLFNKDEQTKQEVINKTYYFLKLAMLCVK